MDLKLHLAGPCDRNLSRYKNTITPSGGAVTGNRISVDGTDGKVDCGDIGNIKAVSFWVKPNSDTEELLLVDTGNDIMIDSGTVTYTGLTAIATYINAAATTTYKGNFWQHIVCVFTQIDANNFEIGTDGSNYGQSIIDDIRAYDDVLDLEWTAPYYEMTRRCY